MSGGGGIRTSIPDPASISGSANIALGRRLRREGQSGAHRPPRHAHLRAPAGGRADRRRCWGRQALDPVGRPSSRLPRASAGWSQLPPSSIPRCQLRAVRRDDRPAAREPPSPSSRARLHLRAARSTHRPGPPRAPRRKAGVRSCSPRTVRTAMTELLTGQRMHTLQGLGAYRACLGPAGARTDARRPQERMRTP